MSSVLLEFIRSVVEGDLDEVSRRLAASPALATTASHVGATRQEASAYFFANIAHYLYAGDTALHMAAAAFRRPVAELLRAHGDGVDALAPGGSIDRARRKWYAARA